MESLSTVPSPSLPRIAVCRECTVSKTEWELAIEGVRKIYIPSQNTGRDSEVRRTFRERRGGMIVLSLRGLGPVGAG